MIAAILFDLDGLLADTEILHCRAWQTTLDARGIPLTTAFYYDWWVRQGRGITDFLQDRKLDLPPDTLRADKARHYTHQVNTACTPMPGALALLDRLHGRLPLALVSSSWQDSVHAVLAKLQIADRFATIVTGSDVPRAKPFPDGFLLAAQRLAVPPAACLVLEDAQKGVLAAKAAGMRAIAVPSPHTADHDVSRAERVVSSLDEVTWDLLANLDRAGDRP
jgi:HAD superfamily hydrolase (TIGR01509 family)